MNEERELSMKRTTLLLAVFLALTTVSPAGAWFWDKKEVRPPTASQGDSYETGSGSEEKGLLDRIADYFRGKGREVKQSARKAPGEIKEGARETGRDLKQGGRELKQEAKKVPGEVKEGARDFKEGLKETGHDIKHEAKQFPGKAKEAGREIGHGFKKLGRDLKNGVKKGEDK
jgi:gas vesicle protein